MTAAVHVPDLSCCAIAAALQAVTYQLGMFIGSGLIPVPTSLARPKATLLTAALGMLSFVVAFACALKLNGGPFAMIVLAFFMYMYSG